MQTDAIYIDSKLAQSLFDRLERIEKSLPIKQFYTIKEFSALAGLAHRTIIELCNLGKLKATQINNRGAWLVLASEVDRLKASAIANNDTLYPRNRKSA